MNSYLLFKSLHLIAVISWMAGLLYLPRIFVYHIENKEKKEATDIFEVMERKTFLLHHVSCNDSYLDFWFNINLSKWSRDIFPTLDAIKNNSSYLVVCLQ